MKADTDSKTALAEYLHTLNLAISCYFDGERKLTERNVNMYGPELCQK